jgi:hypothetical protein
MELEIMTVLELQEKGYRVLVEQLGQVDAIRFLQQCGWGMGNYTQERRATIDGLTRDDFQQDLQRVRQRNK